MKLSSDRRSSSLNNINMVVQDLSGGRCEEKKDIQKKLSRDIDCSDDTESITDTLSVKVDPSQYKKLSRIECWLLLIVGTISGLVCSIVISYSIMELTYRIESIGNFTDLARPVDGLSGNVYSLYTELREVDRIYREIDKIKPLLSQLNETFDSISGSFTNVGRIEHDIRNAIGQVTPIWSQVSTNIFLLELQLRDINYRLQQDWESEINPWLYQLNKTMISIQNTMRDSSRVSREISQEYSKINPIRDVTSIGVDNVGVDNVDVNNVEVENVDVDSGDNDKDVSSTSNAVQKSSTNLIEERGGAGTGSSSVSW